MQPARAVTGGQPGKEQPKRSAVEWRPAALLCKRLNVPDPFKGRPKELTMSRFRTDHLVLPDTDLQASAAAAPPLALPGPPPMRAHPAGAPTGMGGPPPGGVQASTGRSTAAAAASEAEPPTQEVQDARALADSFLASLGLHASLAETPSATPAATASHDPAIQTGSVAQQSAGGGQTSPMVAVAAAASVGSRADEADAPDVVTAAALERRAALHKSIFEGDMESESEEDDEDMAEAAPTSASTAAPQPPEDGHPLPGADRAGLHISMGPPPPRQGPLSGSRSNPTASNPMDQSASGSGAPGDASVGGDATDVPEGSGRGLSALGLPVGVQNRPVFMSKKARAAQAAQSQAASAPSAPQPPPTAPAASPQAARQEPIGPDREPASASVDVVRAPGVPAGASLCPAGMMQASSAELGDGSSSSGDDAEADVSGSGRARSGQPGPDTAAAGQRTGAGMDGTDASRGLGGPPLGMSAIHWQRELDARLRDRDKPGKDKKRSKEKEKHKKHKHSHHKKHKHKSNK